MLAPGSLTIRSAKRFDDLFLSKMAMESYAEAFGHSMTREQLLWQLQNNKSLTYFSERIGTDAILLAIIDSRMVGYIQITDVTLPVDSADATDQQLNALYVAHGYKARGVGMRLMDRALKLPRVRSAPHLYVDVWGKNKSAVQFYRRHGFEVIGDTDVVVDSTVIGKDLIMRLTLGEAPKAKARRTEETEAGV
jgi:ribosomal protein S18 acetylase RimI-like enzyme